ncbi:DUF3440 domain-containing protein [Lactococcus sp. DD01]
MWQSYVCFLLQVFPPKTKRFYCKKFGASIKYWTEKKEYYR